MSRPARQNSTLIRTQCDAVVASSGGGVCHNPHDTQTDRDLSRQTAAGATGQAAQNSQQTKGQAFKQAAGEQAGILAVTGSYSRCRKFQPLQVVTAVTVVSAGEGAAVTSLGEACSRPLGVGQTREQLGVPF